MEWLSTINQGTIIIVPTRGLQHSLSKQYSQLQIAAGKVAWHTPQILVWDDYIEQLWNSNKHNLDQAYIRIDNSQSLIIWREIVMESKYKDTDLLLLNEHQTANVVQRSWKLAQKWQIDLNPSNSEQHLSDKDTIQFKRWIDHYQQHLSKKNWIDGPQVERLLVDKTIDLQLSAKSLIFAYFDLLTFNQQKHIQLCEKKQIQVNTASSQEACKDNSVDSLEKRQRFEYRQYDTEDQQWQAVLYESRKILEENPESNIGIIIPSLAENRAHIEQIARQVFYPELNPIEAQKKELAYRFSIGQNLHSIAYIYSMLNALELLKSKFSYQNIRYFLMSEWWNFRYSESVGNELLMRLDQAIKKQGLTWLSWHEVLEISEKSLPDADVLNKKIQQLLEFRDSIFLTGIDANYPDNSKKAKYYFSANQWHSFFAGWLKLLDYSKNQLDSRHYQVHESWLATIDTFIGSDLVQGEINLSNALQLLNSLCKEKVFMRQAKDEPILISGVLEGIGHQVDHLFVTGMHDAYPPVMPKDPFINTQELAKHGYPFADKQAEFDYEQNKLGSLLAGGDNVIVSYAKQQAGVEVLESALLRNMPFKPVESISTFEKHLSNKELEEFTDLSGLECLQSARIKGGSRVFENQSQCPFKAYIEHRILISDLEEPEFGLDARDTGTIVHELLENIWGELGSSSMLSSLEPDQLQSYVDRHVDHYLEQPNSRYQFDRKELLKLEQLRLKRLIFEWLTYEKEHRYLAFTVIGKEQKIQTQFANIPIKLSIDRIDKMDNGDCIVIDYKTGNTAVSDWKDERPKNPQLPLYALALEQEKHFPVKGIAFAQVKTQACTFNGITEIDKVGEGFRNSLDRETLWLDQLQFWRESLKDLADEFLSGYAIVDPSKANPCQYCDLSSVCRIYQLKDQSGQTTEDVMGGKS